MVSIARQWLHDQNALVNYRWLDLCTPQTCMYTQYPTLKLISWSLPAVKSYRASAFGVRSSDNWVVLRVTLVPVAKMWLYDDYRSILSILMVSHAMLSQNVLWLMQTTKVHKLPYLHGKRYTVSKLQQLVIHPMVHAGSITDVCNCNQSVDSTLLPSITVALPMNEANGFCNLREG